MITTATTSREIRGPEHDGSSARPGSPSSGTQQRQENPGDLTGATFGKASSGALGNFFKGMKSFLAELRGEDVSTSGAVATTQKTSLQTAQEMVDSYAFDEKTGVSTFTAPAGVTDVEAMKALNEYFRKNLPNLERDAVWALHLERFENLPKDHRAHCEQRDYSQARQITITAVVKGTAGESRTTQGSVLKDDSLVFSDPRDQALAAAIHACKHEGENLFQGLEVRGSVPGFALRTNRYHGVEVLADGSDFDRSFVAASGSPSPELKKA
jgi:hypothetical protein